MREEKQFLEQFLVLEPCPQYITSDNPHNTHTHHAPTTHLPQHTTRPPTTPPQTHTFWSTAFFGSTAWEANPTDILYSRKYTNASWNPGLKTFNSKDCRDTEEGKRGIEKQRKRGREEERKKATVHVLVSRIQKQYTLYYTVVHLEYNIRILN